MLLKLKTSYVKVIHNLLLEYQATIIQLTFTCSKSTMETLEKGVKYLQS